MSSPPLELGKPTEIEIADQWMPSPRAQSTPVAAAKGSKRSLGESPGSEAMTRPRSSARRSIKHGHAAALEDELISPAQSQHPDSTLASPFGAAGASGAAAAAALSPMASTGASPGSSTLGSPDRKIWMRPCNECGFELHVRRVRCTECGAVQMSKRAHAAAAEEERAAAEREEQRAVQAEEAKEAASLLAMVAEAPAAPPATVSPPPPGASTAASSAPPSLPPASPAPSSSSVVSQLARLTPEQLAKLRRMQKLRALLQKLPPGVKLPTTAPRAAQTTAQTADANAAQAPPADGADAISMLASVACM